ncbi:MAG TPA: Hsp20/alpha crystallin family protein [Candidatus Acidoferrales bacterium]|nr:Hsp20/alpha crystallin family protein [Candidatus Acidoferrales bacterium]
MAREERPRWGSWRPFSEWSRWEEEMSKRFEDLFERSRRWWPSFGASGPPVDVYEEEDDIVVRIELPGMEKSDVDVTLTGRSLTIKGEKKKTPEPKEKDYYRNEISYGTFSRVIELPLEVQPGQSRAQFDKGVLEVRLPKAESAKRSTKIEIG